jgi:uncharacterized membrane protein YqhA
MNNPIERIFEGILWNSRYLMVIPVLVGLIISLGVLIVTTIDSVGVVIDVIGYFAPAADAAAQNAARLAIISEVVGIIDGYLLAAILIIFALGLYELFVNKIDIAEGSEFASRLLLIRNLDDLKDRLAKVILVILIVKFFQAALTLKYESVLDLLYLALGILFIGAALYLSIAKPAKPDMKDE